MTPPASRMFWTRNASSSVPPAATPAAPPVSAEEVTLAYRVMLGREPDGDGLAHYVERGGRDGLTLAGLIEILRHSDEYRARRDASAVTTEPAAREAPDLITPADVIARHTFDELVDAADEYYRRIPDPTPLVVKPFAYWHEAPQMLHDLGLLLSGMSLGKSMTVLDFGGGTGWLSRILTQLNCRAICCDVSRHALDIARDAADRHPPIGTAPYRPVFLVFDGRRIDLPDESVDRIVCFDAFHHVPNPDVVIAELGRVLRPGGLAGFSEPGPRHSRSAQSQYEMRHHKVLENDIDLREIAAMARRAGFTDVTAKTLVERDLSLDEYVAVTGGSDVGHDGLRADLWRAVRQTMANRSVFYLHKGPLLRDSRSHQGLAHALRIVSAPARVEAGQSFSVEIDAANAGDTAWLHENGAEIFGIVRVGTHLSREDGTLVALDHAREALPHRVAPGDRVSVSVPLVIDAPGAYRVDVDLVAEGVTWFENVGSAPASFVVAVTERAS